MYVYQGIGLVHTFATNLPTRTARPLPSRLFAVVSRGSIPGIGVPEHFRRLPTTSQLGAISRAEENKKQKHKQPDFRTFALSRSRNKSSRCGNIGRAETGIDHWPPTILLPDNGDKSSYSGWALTITIRVSRANHSPNMRSSLGYCSLHPPPAAVSPPDPAPRLENDSIASFRPN